MSYGTIVINRETGKAIDLIKSRKKGKHKLFLEPIPFEVLKGSIFLKVKKNLKKELYKKTHSRALFKSLKLAASTDFAEPK